MSNQYKLMIYFVMGTLAIYENDIIHDERMTPDDFIKLNKDVTDRIHQEALNIFQYELSYNQLVKGVLMYLTAKLNKQSVKSSLPYNPDK